MGSRACDTGAEISRSRAKQLVVDVVGKCPISAPVGQAKCENQHRQAANERNAVEAIDITNVRKSATRNAHHAEPRG